MKRPLILIPTPAEYRVVQPRIASAGIDPKHIALCGFGLIAAAARTMQLIAQHQPDEVLLVGIAGSFASETPVGDAILFDEVTCYGIGSGTGINHESAADMGWPQIAGESAASDIGDTILIPGLPTERTQPRSGRLLSVTAASGDASDASLRRQKYPDATAEDMEGYGVALACRLMAIPFDIVRGLSNPVGNRDITNWQIQPAFESAADLAAELIAE